MGGKEDFKMEMKRIDLVNGISREINKEVFNDLVSRTTVVPTAVGKKGRNRIIRKANVKTPKEIISQITDTNIMTDEKIIELAQKILKSKSDMEKADNNETNIAFCKGIIKHFPKGSFTYYAILCKGIIKYLGDGIRERAITIALRELVEEGFLEEAIFYINYTMVNGYKVK